jgi:hypothetical protein
VDGLVDALGFLLAAEGLLTTSDSRPLLSLTLRFSNPVLGIAVPFLSFIFTAFIRSFKGKKVAFYLKLKLSFFEKIYTF